MSECNMSHLNEEALILHYYGEESETLSTEQHLEACGECRETYASLVRVLNVVDSLPVPDRGENYGAQVWSRIEKRIPARRRFGWLIPVAMPMPMRWAAAGAALAGLLVVAFMAGRFYPGLQNGLQKQVGPRTTTASLAADTQAPERILLVAVGDYLERSQMVLVELANANTKGPLDISSEQERAADLVSESRLYRQTAAHTGNTAVANVLDDLDRVLLEISHAPSRLSAEELENLRQRLEAEGILFKIRVLGSNFRNQEEPAPSAARQKL